MSTIKKLIFLSFFFAFLFETRSVFAQVVINEFLPNPSSGGNEWVELYNSGSSAIGLSGWVLSDSANPSKPLDVLIEVPAGGFTVFINNGDNWLNNSSNDSVILKDNLGAVVDSYSYTSTFDDDESMGRSPDGSSNWIKFSTSSQGTANPAPTPTTVPPTATPIPPTPTPSLSPTPTPTNTPIPTSTLTPTPKPTAKPTIKPTPTFGIELEPTDSLEPEVGPTEALTSDQILGLENKDWEGNSSGSAFSKFLNKIPWFPVLAIGAGVLFIGFSVFTFLKAKKQPTV